MTLSSEKLAELTGAARRVQARAYAPYSNFHVGAALLTEAGEIIEGCNVENASYGLTICAERTAIGRLVAMGSARPIACVVVGPTKRPLTPCGACRQVLLEFNPEMTVVCIGSTGESLTMSARELLPGSFASDALDEAARGE
jgi:cytidine deaminase